MNSRRHCELAFVLRALLAVAVLIAFILSLRLRI
ncbi:hypothetical protein Verru16b_01729 [Lacunisphaera limnophila]|uniref:Uncharacterized protein n=1 Tax=Lacunisphaera limnophila TaxID=1838286 RepID=A0A1D8AUV7_9BACT|nr:hypothetical protein Verru16b_01729 [Lacunisphaera limnophila]